MKQIVRYYERQYALDDRITFNMMLHNVEIMPGKNRYTQNVEAYVEYFRHLELFLRYCVDRGVEFVALEELHSIYSRGRDVPSARRKTERDRGRGPVASRSGTEPGAS